MRERRRGRDQRPAELHQSKNATFYPLYQLADHFPAPAYGWAASNELRISAYWLVYGLKNDCRLALR